MNYLLFLGILQSLFFFLLIITNKRKALSDFFVCSWFLLIALHLLYYYSVFHNDFSGTSFYLVSGFFLPLIYGPINFFYIKSLLEPIGTKPIKILIHLIPYIFFILIFFALNISDKYDYIIENGRIIGLTTFSTLFKNVGYCLAIQGAAYVFYNYYLITKHQSKLLERTSNMERINLQWIKVYIIGNVLGFLVIFFVSYFSDSLFTNTSIFSTQIVMITLIVQVTYFGFYAIKQTNLFSNKDDYNLLKQKYAKSGLAKKDSYKIKTLLEEFIDTQKPYLNPELTIGKLANDLNVSQNHLSQTINEHFKQNFFTYINFHRVNYVKELIKKGESKNMSLLGLAFESGFSSKSSFNSVFKKITTQTPNEYKKSLQNKSI